MCFMQINLYVKENADNPESKWSDPIPGIGGSFLIAQEKSGLHADDEAWKKAYTDAISVACKALGIGASVYWNGDPDNKAVTALPPAPVEKPKALAEALKEIDQEQLTEVVRYKYGQLEKGSPEAKAFIAKIVETIGNKNYTDVPDAAKRLALYNAIKEM